MGMTRPKLVAERTSLQISSGDVWRCAQGLRLLRDVSRGCRVTHGVGTVGREESSGEISGTGAVLREEMNRVQHLVEIESALLRGRWKIRVSVILGPKLSMHGVNRIIFHVELLECDPQRDP